MAAQSMNALRWAARDCSGLVSPFSFSRNTTSLKNPMISDKKKKRQQLAIVAETDRLPVKAAALAETLLPAEDAVVAETQLPVKAAGWAAWDTTGVLSPFKFSRRETGPYDVQFKVMYCGICHSDLHFLKNEWAQTIYPIVPGHEVVGIVTEVGPQVTKVKVGDKVGVGCMVNSCRKCHNCSEDLENYCPNAVFTYNSTDVDGTNTYGGYSNIMVANEHMIVKWPESLPLTGAPLLCAGITTYSAMKYYGVNKPGLKVGVVGLGGLGHVAVRFAKAFGMKVTVISSSSHKKDEALEHFGAHGFLNSRDTVDMEAAAGSLDAIIDTVSATHPMQPLLSLLKTSGKLVMVGLPEKPLSLPAMPLISGRKMLGGSMIGGMKETQEMIDFAAEHNIMPDVEVVPMNYVNKAFERLEKGDVKYRFVLDIGNTMDDDVVKEETTSCSISL